MRPCAAPEAMPSVCVGRMIEQIGNVRRRNTVGSGMIRLASLVSPPALRSGKTRPVMGSVSGGAFPALSCQVWKCIVSVGPMESMMRSTSGSLTRCASPA